MASAFNGLAATFSDRPKILGLEAGAADQAAVNIGQRDKLAGIVGFHGTAVQDTDTGGLLAAQGLGKAVADQCVDFLNLIIGRRTTGADGPHRFIGNHRVGGVRRIRKRPGQLPFDDVESFSAVALLFRFAEADNGREAAGLCDFGFGLDLLIGFAVIGTAFRVADNDVAPKTRV